MKGLFQEQLFTIDGVERSANIEKSTSKPSSIQSSKVFMMKEHSCLTPKQIRFRHRKSNGALACNDLSPCNSQNCLIELSTILRDTSN